MIASRLCSRSHEIVQAIHIRVLETVPDPTGSDDVYRDGLLATVYAVLTYCLTGIERGPGWSAPIPSEAATQARGAARRGVGLGIVMRRYIAGHEELGSFVAQEVERAGLSHHGSVPHHLRETQGALLERLTAFIEDEYNHERTEISLPPEQRRLSIVRRLLAEEVLDRAELTELDYEIRLSWHICLIAVGPEAELIPRRLKASLAARILSVACGEHTVWVWVGSLRRLTAADIERSLPDSTAPQVLLTIGEPGRSVEGWRLTYQQAQEAFAVGRSRPRRFTRYGDSPLLAAALKDITLARSLEQKYLMPLREQRDGGIGLYKTLRAYIDAQCGATSAAATVNVNRRTVTDRVRTVEKLIGQPINTCLSELDVALRLGELDGLFSPDDPSPKP
jgi:hypothetical protein